MDIISREEALEKGLIRFFTGVPCKRGHISEIYVSGSACIECAKLSRKGRLTPIKIYNVGYNSGGRGKGYPAKTSDGILREYDHWRRMLQRAYDTRWKLKHNTYNDCKVSEDWFDYQTFAKDYHECKYKTEKSDLDKDLLVLGNKLYSKELCVYLPEELNKAIMIRGNISVFHKRDSIFETICNGQYLGRSNNPLDLADLWLDVKYNHIATLAIKYKDVISPAAYKSLMNIKIGITKDGEVFRES